MNAYKPIEAYGVIGDLRTAALVGRDGSIDFLCFPRFDSPTVFAALLDARRGGAFQVAPVLEDVRYKQLYLPDANVLLSRFLSDEGVAEVSDFMTVEPDRPSGTLVRRAKTVRGRVRFRLVCAPRFDYGRAAHRVEVRGQDVLFLPEGGATPPLRLRSQVPLRVVNGDAVAEFTLDVGQTAAFLLGEASEDQAARWSAPGYVAEAFKATLNFWRRWIARSLYRGRWREMVNRSALTLKLLTSGRDGSMVAAPTFGLPEHVGGERNWDYRYTWIRDASMALGTLIQLGYLDEATAFLRWLEGRFAGPGAEAPLQPLYGLDGRREVAEEILPHLEGYRGSSPVRIGNAASSQLQLDVYGELFDAIYLYSLHGEPLPLDLWQDLVRHADWVCRHWRDPDDGIWEVRAGRRQFLSSRVMCWVALDRALKLARRWPYPAPVEEWRRSRDEIYRDVLARFWDSDRRAFVQYPETTSVGAASLLMPLVGFISPVDPRWLATLRAVETDLVDDSLVYRYRVELTPDGLRGREGTFWLCSFWYVECVSRSGDVEKARFLFEKMLGYANHLGLYAEQLGPCGEHLGNFPQALSHLALIRAACDINARLEAAGKGG
jgi:GH15 family glucan-1,4-alpha-glucosidase